MDMKLEVVVLPVADVGRAKNFYKALGRREDADFATGEDFRAVQVTPPGSPRSVILGTGLTSVAPGSAQGLQPVVTDIDAARAELADRGAEVSDVFHDAWASSTTPEPRGGCPARPRTKRAMARSFRSATRRATAGSSRRSSRVCPGRGTRPDLASVGWRCHSTKEYPHASDL